MPHGDPHPASGSSYIIICNGRINVLIARTSDEKIKAVSECAKDLACYLGIRYKGIFDVADLVPIQTAQHLLMDSLMGSKKIDVDVDAKIVEMFDMFEVLEHKYDSGGGY